MSQKRYKFGVYAFVRTLAGASIPVSRICAFLDIIAGCEFAIATIDRVRPFNQTLRIVAIGAANAAFGLVVAVTLAVGLPRLAQWIEAHPGWG